MLGGGIRIIDRPTLQILCKVTSSATDLNVIKNGYMIYAPASGGSTISVIDTETLKETYLLLGHKQTIIKIDFHKENELITADEDDRLMFWRLE